MNTHPSSVGVAASDGSGQTRDTSSSLGRLLLLFGALAPPAMFLAAALTRRLNFDEPLSLRSGWLLLSGIPAQPDFYMPTTLALGALAHGTEDPGVVFAIARGVAGASVLATGLWALQRSSLPVGVATGTAVLCLLQASFASHAYEFRYDWAILIGWLLAFGLLQRRRALDFAGLGVCIGWLAAHHLKGLFFAGALYAIAGVAAATTGERRVKLTWLHAGLVGSVSAWLAISVALGFANELPGIFRFFAGVAVEQPRVGVWTALWPSWERDLVWWALAAVAVTTTTTALARRARATRSLPALLASPEALALVFAAPPLLFLLAHPYPWPYMLALPAPFLALVMASWIAKVWSKGGGGRVALATLGGVSVGLYGLSFGVWPGSAYLLALESPNTAQVESLRLLRRLAEPGEKIIDPSGLAYFLPPCTSQWYLDTLLTARAERGEWMGDLAERGAAECPWILNTYRFGMIPRPTREWIAQQYRFGTGGLVLARDDRRLQNPELWPRFAHHELYTFWW